jgi:hypothetical protein
LPDTFLVGQVNPRHWDASKGFGALFESIEEQDVLSLGDTDKARVHSAVVVCIGEQDFFDGFYGCNETHIVVSRVVDLWRR